MTDMLSEIVESKKAIVARAKRKMPLRAMREQISHGGYGKFAAAHRLRGNPWSLIAECKKRSPSKGELCDYSVLELARKYEKNGATMLSIHTDPHFDGCNEELAIARSRTNLPIMRKDFIIDEYQIYESRMLGADAVLLIARMLSPERLLSFLYTTWGLGMDALVEVHDEADLAKALATPAEFIGINNRNLVTFETDISNTVAMMVAHGELAKKRTVISESGISSRGDAELLRRVGCRGILVGEGLVRAKNIGKQTRELALA